MTAGTPARATTSPTNTRSIDSIDHLLREPYRVRGDLIGEIRLDEDERIARVDRLLAAHRARQAGHLDAEVDR